MTEPGIDDNSDLARLKEFDSIVGSAMRDLTTRLSLHAVNEHPAIKMDWLTQMIRQQPALRGTWESHIVGINLVGADRLAMTPLRLDSDSIPVRPPFSTPSQYQPIASPVEKKEAWWANPKIIVPTAVAILVLLWAVPVPNWFRFPLTLSCVAFGATFLAMSLAELRRATFAFRSLLFLASCLIGDLALCSLATRLEALEIKWLGRTTLSAAFVHREEHKSIPALKIVGACVFGGLAFLCHRSAAKQAPLQ